MSESHIFPWEAHAEDKPGFDRILLSSKFKAMGEFPCGGDGYPGSYDPVLTKPITWILPTAILRGVAVKNAFLQLFIDDFQASSFCSNFQLFINGTPYDKGRIQGGFTNLTQGHFQGKRQVLFNAIRLRSLSFLLVSNHLLRFIGIE